MYTVTLNTPQPPRNPNTCFFFFCFLSIIIIMVLFPSANANMLHIAYRRSKFWVWSKILRFFSLLFKFYFRRMAALTTRLQFNVNAAKSQPGRLFCVCEIDLGCDLSLLRRVGELKTWNYVVPLEQFERKYVFLACIRSEVSSANRQKKKKGKKKSNKEFRQ